MPRPCKRRWVGDRPTATVFKPTGVPGHALETVELGLDELEALRLADLEGLYQDAAAERMNISRATFGRVLQSARRKVATALLEGRMLVFQGGPVEQPAVRQFACAACGQAFELPFGTGRPESCPHCGAATIGRSDGGGRRRRGCGGGGRGWRGGA